MRALVDTSVWIFHLKSPVMELEKKLADRGVLTHPVVIGELALGRFRERDRVLSYLKMLPRAEIASHDECLDFIEHHKLQGHGLGFSDVQLLASARLSHVMLLSFDKALLRAANQLGLLQN